MQKKYPTRKKPYSLNQLCVEITRRCNKKCEHCMKGEAQDLTITEEIIDKIVTDIPDVSRLLLAGGESLLELDKIAYLIEKVANSLWNVKMVEITTNGTICDERIVDIFESLCIKKPECSALLRISNDSFHTKSEYEQAYAFYRPLVNSSNERINLHGAKGRIHLLYSNLKDTPESLIYSGRAMEYIDSGKGNYSHGINVQYRIGNKHRVKILDDIIPCTLDVLANGNICLGEEVSYTLMDNEMSIGNILTASFSEIVDKHNHDCLLLCSETDLFMLEEVAKRDSNQFMVINYLKFRNTLCRRILGLREEAQRRFPNVPAQSIISQLQFPTDEETREIALWIWENEFPRDISEEVTEFAKAFDEHLDTPEEAMYFDGLYQLITTWWDINNWEITMPPHYLEKEKRIFWGIEFDNEFYENPMCLPWNENYECNAKPNGDISYTTSLSMSANREYEQAMYSASIENMLSLIRKAEQEMV